MYRYTPIIYLCLIFLIFTESSFPQESEKTDTNLVHIFIIAGQSNAINIHSDAEDLSSVLIDTSVYFYYHCGMPPDRNIPYFSTSKNKWTKLSKQRQVPFQASYEYFFGPEITLISSLRNQYKNLAVIKCAYGGSNLAQDWKPGAIKGNMLYKTMLDQINNACHLLDSGGIKYSFEGFAWIQGEKDASNQSHAEAYLDNLIDFINRVRNDFKSPGLPFVISRLPSKQPYAFLSLVRGAQETVTTRTENTKWIDTDSLELDKDSVHFLSSGVLKLGTLLASGFNGLITSKNDKTSEYLSDNYELRQNYPNPFNPVTNITFSLPERKNTKLIVYDILGREVSVLADKEMEAGEYKVIFEGYLLPPGVYIYSIQTDNFRDSKKLLLLK